MFKWSVVGILTIILIYVVVSSMSSGKEVKNRINSLASDERYAYSQALKRRAKEKKGINLVYVPNVIRNNVANSGINIRVEEFILVWVSLAVVPALIWNIFSGNLLQSIIIAVICAVIPPLYVSSATNNRKKKFGVQLGDALLLLSNSLRSGFSFEQALGTVAENMPDPVATEFKTVEKELNVGVSLEQSLNSLGERMSNKDVELLTSAVLIQRQVGGNLAEIVDTISETITERIKLKNRVNALTAQGKISGIMIGSLPVALFVIISMINPDYMEIMYTTTFGKIATAIGLVMEVLGFIVIKKMVQI